MKKIVLGSNNAGKLLELGAMLSGHGLEILPQRQFISTEAIEDGLSFVENALIKARYAAHAANLPAIADDSGIVVDALNGAPGIYSARYAGIGASDADNNAKLLRELDERPDAPRSAHFYCILVFLRHALDPAPVIAEGRWDGTILREARGQNGFGYDPLFFVPTHGMGSAELSPAVKNAISHRGQALTTLLRELRAREII